jgi:hypothetical protein
VCEPGKREAQLLNARRRQLATASAFFARQKTQLKPRWGVRQKIADANRRIFA